MTSLRLRAARIAPMGKRSLAWLVALAALVVAIDLVTAATHTAVFVRVGTKNISGPRHLVRDADLDPLAFFMPTAAIVAARRLLPSDATYTIVVGQEAPGPPISAVLLVYRFSLLPRVYTSKVGQAQWAITYNAPSESLGVPYTQEIGLGPGVNAVKLRPSGGR